ncbi:cytochrome-c peroxidase [Variovorax sp. EL159]|uniref:cytochrome-c peroxidase n=1 Tax=Variovorax sp. EL159 TaxID=1566270 RepID=UPI000888DE3B|nr:Cytochrome c peroxidase [Variovorax sp. EL159]
MGGPARQRSLIGGGLALLAACAGWMGGAIAASDSSNVQINPGGPPSVVIERIGATSKIAARIDATEAVFKPDPALAALGKRIFFDARLSQPQGTSCASCHDPLRAFTSTLNAPSLAGPRTPQGSRPGHFSARTAPSLLYVRYVPRRHFNQDDDAPFASPFGGLFADGRADTLAEQARGPLFDPDEMNNTSPQSLLRKLRGTDLAPAMSLAFGPQVLRDPERAVKGIGLALQAFLQSDEMAPFSSRFDDYLRKRTPLSPQEMRGLALFKNPDKGNCMSCHTLSDTASRPERSLFTDFGYDAIAVPRNLSLPANRNPRRFDNGLCRTAAQLRWPEPDQWCGYFRTPGLRNVAVRQSFMHNGVFTTLRDAVAFYATRSTDPAKWYHGKSTFDDVPAAYRANINVNSTPMNRRPGRTPALSDEEIDEISAFLRTLTDAPYVAAMPPMETAASKPAGK